MVVSFIIYLFVNLFENLIHYNIGRLSKNGDKHPKINFPAKNDLFRIIIVMLTFAALQGILTYWFNAEK